MCLIDNIFDEDFDKDWTFYAKQGKPDSAVETVVISEMPKGSEVHLKLKTMVDESLGVEKGQTGCTYPYLVKVVSNALIPYYYREALTWEHLRNFMASKKLKKS